MFLDVRDPWPPVPPPIPESGPEPDNPHAGRPAQGRRHERAVGLVVAVNLGLVLLAPIAGGSLAHAVASIVRHMYR